MHPLLRLQGAAGNRAVAWLVQRTTVEPAAPPAPAPLTSFPEWADVQAGGRLLRKGGASAPLAGAIQSALAGFGHDPGPIDGIWGPKTDAGVRSFQHEHGLVADAVIGPKTASLLSQAQSAGGEGTTVATTGASGGATVGQALTGSGDEATLAQLASLVGLPPQVAVVASALPPPVLQEGSQIVARLAGAGPSAAPSAPASTPAPAATPAPVQRLVAANKKTADAPPGTQFNPAARAGVQLTAADLNFVILLTGAVSTAFAQMKAAGTLNLSPQEIAFCEERLARMGGLFTERQTAAGQGQVVDQRAVVAVALAQSQIGMADSTRPDGIDTTDTKSPQRPFRKSRDRIMEYFDVAYGGGGYSRDVVTHITAGKVWTGKTVEGKKEMKDKSDTLQDWCGIFPLWALRSAGFNVGTWVVGSTIAAVPGFNFLQLKAGDTVRPGDVGLVSKLQHQFIVARVHDDGDTLDTVEGNTDSALGAQGGQVAQHSRRKISTTDVGFVRPADSL